MHMGMGQKPARLPVDHVGQRAGFRGAVEKLQRGIGMAAGGMQHLAMQRMQLGNRIVQAFLTPRGQGFDQGAGINQAGLRRQRACGLADRGLFDGLGCFRRRRRLLGRVRFQIGRFYRGRFGGLLLDRRLFRRGWGDNRRCGFGVCDFGL